MHRKQFERDCEFREQAIKLTKRGREILQNSTMRKVGKGTYILDKKPLNKQL